MNTERNTTRQRLTEQVLDATTLSEVQNARAALRAWIQKYPEEREWMRDGFEQLAQMEEIADRLESEGRKSREFWVVYTCHRNTTKPPLS